MTTQNLWSVQRIPAVRGVSNRVINYLCAQAREHEDYVKIDNTEGVYLPVVVEILSRVHNVGVGVTDGTYEHVSIAHYGKQEGDLMADPEMTFMVWMPEGESESYAYPCTYRNDYVGYSDEGMELSQRNRPYRVCAHKMRDHVNFVRMWMKNINEQQKLNIK